MQAQVLIHTCESRKSQESPNVEKDSCKGVETKLHININRVPTTIHIQILFIKKKFVQYPAYWKY